MAGRPARASACYRSSQRSTPLCPEHAPLCSFVVVDVPSMHTALEPAGPRRRGASSSVGHTAMDEGVLGRAVRLEGVAADADIQRSGREDDAAQAVERVRWR